MIEHVWRTAVHRGKAAGQHTEADFAIALARCGEIGVPTDIQVELAVAIIIEECCPRVEHRAELHSVDVRALRDVGKSTVPVVVIQDVFPILGDI